MASNGSQKKLFLIPVEKRDSHTLLRLLKRHILPGTRIISDCWRAYTNIANTGLYQHENVNHSLNFVDAVTGTHNNNIEQIWREVKANVPKYGQRRTHFKGHLAEFIFKSNFPDFREQMHEFFIAASSLYDMYI